MKESQKLATRPRYHNVGIPAGMASKIEQLLKEHPEWGYRNISEFVIDAVRRRIEELEKLIAEIEF